MITVCRQCDTTFKGKGTKRKFCSIDCRIKAQKEYKLLNQYGATADREQRFKKEFENKFSNFIYVNGFKSIDDSFLCECKKCGNKKEINAQCLRSYNNLRCFFCIEVRKTICKMINETQSLLNKEVKALKKQIEIELQPIQKELELIKKELRSEKQRLTTCIECGKAFKYIKRKRKYCSEACQTRKNRRRKEAKRRQLELNGDYILLDVLIKRDKNICHICNRECNKKNYKRNSKGHFIVGKSYPSIDHVIALDNGGTHTWDNVKLAHHYCNSIKNNKLFFVATKNQLTFSI
jgi:5-methylcytosine-specific restriction endonuclease McrA